MGIVKEEEEEYASDESESESGEEEEEEDGGEPSPAAPPADGEDDEENILGGMEGLFEGEAPGAASMTGLSVLITQVSSLARKIAKLKKMQLASKWLVYQVSLMDW